MLRRAGPDKLSAFATAVLQSAGADAASSEAASWAMIHASLHGVDSHGIRLLPWYADCLRTGVAKGNPQVRVELRRRAAALVDADDGLGHIAMYRAMDEACALARDCGIGMASVINSTHFGAAGAYTLAAAQAGFIGLVASNSGAFVVPHDGSPFTERARSRSPHPIQAASRFFSTWRRVPYPGTRCCGSGPKVLSCRPVLRLMQQVHS